VIVIDPKRLPASANVKRLWPLKPSDVTSMSTAHAAVSGLAAHDREAGVGADQLVIAPIAHRVAAAELPAVVVDPAVGCELGEECVGVARR